jgi:divalent metal cation (Fe/Co/Zn/Cd) transporter
MICVPCALIYLLQVWDGVGSVLVGLILAGVAVYLIQRNRSFLIGRSMKKEDFDRIVRHLKRDPVIKNIYEAKSEEIGEGIYRYADVRSMCQDVFVQRSPSALYCLSCSLSCMPGRPIPAEWIA